MLDFSNNVSVGLRKKYGTTRHLQMSLASSGLWIGRHASHKTISQGFSVVQ